MSEIAEYTAGALVKAPYGAGRVVMKSDHDAYIARYKATLQQKRDRIATLERELLEAKEREAKCAALHKAADAVVAYAGAHGSITARGDLMQSLLDALYAIDGGNYDPKEPK